MAPEDKAKQNMAKSLFGGPKGPTSNKPAPAATVSKPPEQKKKVEKVEKVQTTDLLWFQ